MAQVVGLQWLNPLQWRDYPTEWALLWTMGLAKANKKDHYANTEPEKFGSVQVVADIANPDGEIFKGYHHKYVDKLIYPLNQPYFSSWTYFYTVSPDNKKDWRELAGIHVEYALPDGRLDTTEATQYLQNTFRSAFSIGPPYPPTLWTRSTLPDVRVRTGGPNIGFASLSAALDYLQTNPDKSVWVMSWDAPTFPKNAPQMDENMVLLILTGPDFKTEREPLAWVGYPASRKVSEFESRKGEPSRLVQAWKATIEAAARQARKTDTAIGFAIHDANNRSAESSQRIGALAESLTTEVPEFDFVKQTFNTPALLGDMGASSALTNVALAISRANHLGQHVLVAGTTDPEQPIALLVVPPAKVRPIDPEQDWFRACGENNAYLPWWGLRHDAKPRQQGYSN